MLDRSSRSRRPRGTRLGQHFLHSPGALQKIQEAAELTSDDVVLEIGPGKGALTQALLSVARKVVAVEKDAALVAALEERFAEELASGRLELIAGDILAFDPEHLRAQAHSYKVVANIPYYITGAILEKFLSAPYQPERLVLLVQKEVAERAAAKDGKESILSLSVKAYGTPRLVARVAKGSFNPPPAVDSAILLVAGVSRARFAGRAHEERFFELVRAGFAHKRKLLRSNLAGRLPLLALAAAGIAPNARAEDVSLAGWLALSADAENARAARG